MIREDGHRAPRPLRTGLLLDSGSVPGWIAPALCEAANGKLIDLRLAIVAEGSELASPHRGQSRTPRDRSLLTLGLYGRLDRWLGRASALPPDVPLDAVALCAKVVACQPARTRFTDRLPPEVIAEIRGQSLDLLLRFGFRILTGEVLTCTPLGVWSFHHGDTRSNRGGPACLWEVLLDHEVSGVTLQRLTERLDGGPVLTRSVVATARFNWSKNRRRVYAKSGSLLLQALRQARHDGGGPSPAPGQLPEEWAVYDRPLFRRPTNLVLLRHLASNLRRYVRHRVTAGRRHGQWHLAYCDGDDGHGPDPRLYRYRVTPSPPGTDWADPFPVRVGNRIWLFFEELVHAEGRGRICVAEVLPGIGLGTIQRVLDEPFHLSYPNVFSHQAAWYMLPECPPEEGLRLYRAEAFPFRWSLVGTIVGAHGADPTLCHWNGSWYLFASDGTADFGRSEELNLFVGASPLGPFTPHPANPIVRDVRHARMAGRFLHVGGRLYRPAQRAVPHYGSGISLRHVTELTPTGYAEVETQVIAPHWAQGARGVHTLNWCHGLSVVDLLR